MMGHKSRGNYNINYDNGKDPQDYQHGVRERIVYGDSKNEDRKICVKVMRYEGCDGSKLEKPISEAYYKNLSSRKYMTDQTSKVVLPGDYGSGKKVPKD